MNLLVVLVGAYVVSLASDLGSAQVEDSEWTNYKLQHGKVYDTSSGVDAFRRSMYEHNKQRVEQFNSERPEAESFRLKVNKFSDWTESERARLFGLRPEQRAMKGAADKEPRNSPKEQALLDLILNDTSIPVPDALDWRKTPGRVGDVKDQGACGSSWAFATTGALEGQENVGRPKRRALGSFKEFMFYNNARKRPTVTLLSEQNLMDCVEGCFACDEGYVDEAFRYIQILGGIQDERSYPYEGRKGPCRFNESKAVLSDSGSLLLPDGDEQRLKTVVAKFGPVAVAIDPYDDLFMNYESGVYVSDKCSSSVMADNPHLLVVGYDTDPKAGDYWIVKNSWGKDWGDSGYIKMARNRNNMCGIATQAIIPTF